MLRFTVVSFLTLTFTPVASLAGIVRGPYLQDPRPDRVTIACETDAPASCTVDWGSGLANSSARVTTTRASSTACPSQLVTPTG